MIPATQAICAAAKRSGVLRLEAVVREAAEGPPWVAGSRKKMPSRVRSFNPNRVPRGAASVGAEQLGRAATAAERRSSDLFCGGEMASGLRPLHYKRCYFGEWGMFCEAARPHPRSPAIEAGRRLDCKTMIKFSLAPTIDPHMKRITAVFGFAFCIAAGPAAPQTIGGSRAYNSLDECLAVGQLSKDMCTNAFTNAQAEFNQKTPDFKTRESCERAFGPRSCMIAICTTAAATLPGRGHHACGISFTPRFNGIVVTVASLHNATARPNVSGRGGANYGARTILKIDTIEHHVYAARGSHGRGGSDIPADALPEGAAFDPNAIADPNPNPSGPIASYPVPAKRLKEMQDRARSLGLAPP
jgi:uncharacterized protein YgiB involved in biofilm formation